MRGLDGKVAIVTGGGSGIGEAIAKALVSKGVKVVVSDINLKGAERVAQEIAGAGGTASAVQARHRERRGQRASGVPRSVHLRRAALRGQQRRHWRRRGPGREVDLADWDRVININLNGVLYGMRYQIPAMLKAGARSSAIVNMASIHGFLLSDEASFMTGGYYLVDGGYTAV